jgi:tRNA dimethylallyltransferase
MQPYLIIICGPTGIGKTGIGVELAKLFSSVIISADSRQIFKEMSIGTAVPSNKELSSVPHHFIKTRSIHEAYNASMYEIEVNNFLNEYFKNNQIAFMVGGSGMYIDAVCNGIDDLPAIDKAIREKWHAIYIEKGLEYLQNKVNETDPEYFQRVDKNNPKRLQKALEIYEITGKPYSSFLTRKIKKRTFSILKIALNTNRDELYNRINLRVDKMMNSGLLEEVKSLYPYKHLSQLNTVGYRELFEYMDGKLSYEDAVAQIRNHSRAYARRQITWFRKDKSIKWFQPEDIGLIKQYIEEQIKQ